MGSKVCTLCKEELPLENFAKKGNGKQSRCRPCHNLYTRRHYQENKAYYKAKAKRNDKKYVDPIRAFKEENPCADCGLYFRFCQMDFDHRPGEKKNNNVSQIKGRKKRAEEIAKCDLVCANCHRLRTWNRSKQSSLVK